MRIITTFSLLLILAACSDLEFPQFQKTDPHPVSTKLQALYDEVLIMVADDAPRNTTIEDEFRSWKTMRDGHCLSRYSDHQEDGNGLKQCFAAMDKGKHDSLKRLKFSLLLEKTRPSLLITPNDLNFKLPPDKPLMRGTVQLSNNSDLLAIGNTKGELVVYDTLTAQKLFEHKPFDRYSSYIEFVPNSRLIAVTSMQQHGLVFLDAYSGEEYLRINKIHGDFKLLDNGRYILWSDKKDMVLTNTLTEEDFVVPIDSGSYLLKLEVDKHHRQFAITTHGGDLELWRINELSSHMPLEHIASTVSARSKTGRLGWFALSDDGKYLFGVTTNGHLNLWTLPTLELNRLERPPSINISAVGYFNDRFIVAYEDKRSRQRHLYAYNPATHLARTTQLRDIHIRGLFNIDDTMLLVNTFGMEKMQAEELNETVSLVSMGKAEKTKSQTTSDNLHSNRLIAPEEEVIIEAIGVYEGKYPRTRKFREELTGTVQVNVGTSKKPLALVLSSYSPVNWIINKSSNTKIKYIILNSSQTSYVTNVPGAKIIRTQSKYPYALHSSEYHYLERTVTQYFGRRIDAFQGKYSGEFFNVGSVATASDLSNIRKFESKDGVVTYSDR